MHCENGGYLCFGRSGVAGLLFISECLWYCVLIASNALFKTRFGINTLAHPIVSSFLSAAIGRTEPQPCLLSQKVDTYFVPEQRIDRSSTAANFIVRIGVMI